MKLIVGLGNPGGYAHTRHNVGWDVVEQLVRRHRASWQRTRPPAGVRYAQWNNGQTRVLVPLVMMNISGIALVSALHEWNVESPDLLIVCDDVNLPLGRLRLRAGGSDGGHHGLASCLEALGTREVPRLRIGVGRESLPKDLTEFVLSPFTSDEQGVVDEAVKRAMEACEIWAVQGMQVAMNRVNTQNRMTGNW